MCVLRRIGRVSAVKKVLETLAADRLLRQQTETQTAVRDFVRHRHLSSDRHECQTADSFLLVAMT